MTPFAGWRGDFQGFFRGLAADNSKAYFAAHRTQYDEEVRAPMVALLADLEPEFGPARLSRPNRDIRFTADKSPYKLNIYASAADGGYVALDAEALTAAGGRYVMEPPQLDRCRAAVAADKSGRRLETILARLVDRGYNIGGQELKRAPAPYPRDHPREGLLRHKRLIYWKRWELGPWIATREPLERVAATWRDGDELEEWLAKHVG